MKKLFLISVMESVLVMAAAVSGAEARPHETVTCRSFTVPVSLAAGQPANFKVSGELCATEAELDGGATVQLLIHGSTYSHHYWDFGEINGIEYSYARDVAARGFATFALDEVGNGDSSRPPSDQVTIQSAAFVAHQIVKGLRDGSIAGVSFGKVIIVGHSLGSLVVWQEAISYGDV